MGVLPFRTPAGRCPSAVGIREQTIAALDDAGVFASAEAVGSRREAQALDVIITVEANLAGFSMNPTVSGVTSGGTPLFSGKAPTHMNAKCGLDAESIARFVVEQMGEDSEARHAAEQEARGRAATASDAATSVPPAATGGLTKADLAEAVKEALKSASAPATAPASRTPSSDADAPGYRVRPDDKKFAVIVGVERYNTLPEARFAERDARAVRAHALALGFPERNVVLLTGAQATRTGLVKNVETWLARNVTEDSSVLFYFSGHGAPDAASGQAYLVPVDGDPAYLEDTGYPVKRLYEKLAALKTPNVLVALDACFSGAGGRSVLPRGARPLVARLDAGDVSATRLTALTASGAEQISGTLEEQGHGLFTYYLLRGLNGAAVDGTGAVTAASLHAYLKPRVEDAARRENREQTPRLQAGRDAGSLRLR